MEAGPSGAGPSGGDNVALDSGQAEQRRALARTFVAMQTASAQGSFVLVSFRQKGNPVLDYIKNVRWQFADIVPDYILGSKGTVALYISLRYHLLNPTYLLGRLKELQNAFRLRLVLCQVDVDDVVKPLNEINKLAATHNAALVCSWSYLEVARYIETFRLYENKTASDIKERVDPDYMSRVTDALTSIRGVNNTDVITLGTRFGSLAAIMAAAPEQLATCPGIGPTKVKRIQEAFRAPFRRQAAPLRQPRIDEHMAAGAGVQPPVQGDAGVDAGPAPMAAPEAAPPAGENPDAGEHEEAGDEAEERSADEEDQGEASDEEAARPRADMTDFLVPEDSDEEELPSVFD